MRGYPTGIYAVLVQQHNAVMWQHSGRVLKEHTKINFFPNFPIVSEWMETINMNIMWQLWIFCIIFTEKYIFLI